MITEKEHVYIIEVGFICGFIICCYHVCLCMVSLRCYKL